MINNIYRIILGGVIIMNVLGMLMDAVWIRGTGNSGYFDLDLKYRVHIPFWLLADIAFIAVSLIAAFFFTGARIHLTSSHGDNNNELSKKLIGVNLILIPSLLVLFLFINPDKLSHGKLMNSLLDKRVIYLNGEVTHAQAERIDKAIMLLNAQDESREITIYIYSYGGEVIPGLDIYNMIKDSKAPVNCIVRNKALSIATVILQACEKRMAMEHSYLLIHSVEMSGRWNIFEERLERDIENAKQDQLKINRLLSERSGLPMEVIADLSRKAELIRPEQANRLGLIDEVI